MKYLILAFSLSLFVTGCGKRSVPEIEGQTIPFLISFHDESFIGPLGTAYSVSDTEVNVSAHCELITSSHATIVFWESSADGKIIREDKVTIPLDVSPQTIEVFDLYKFNLKREI